MDVIRNYLESMFAAQPNTFEVIKAKQELYSMMEDKYTELIEEGKPENEAVAIVISEFGNLDELKETLGIADVMSTHEDINRRKVSLEEAFDYISQMARYKLLVGIGVMLCIICPVGLILSEPAFSYSEGVAEAVGVTLLFVCIAIGVALFIYSGTMMKKWDFLKQYPCYIDYSTADAINREELGDRPNSALRLAVGIILCILSVVPVAVFSALFKSEILVESIGPAILLVMVGLGVLLIIVSGAKSEAYKVLISLNDRTTVSGNYEGMNREEYDNPTVEKIMSVFWPTVTCVYLIWSFLSFQWYKTWLIWPIAGVISALIKNIYGRKSR